MRDLKWSSTEKKLARHAYDTALELTLARTMADFKAKAAAATTPSEMWDIEEWLRQQRQEISELFDYRYSQLPLVFRPAHRAGPSGRDAAPRPVAGKTGSHSQAPGMDATLTAGE